MVDVSCFLSFSIWAVTNGVLAIINVLLLFLRVVFIKAY